MILRMDTAATYMYIGVDEEVSPDTLRETNFEGNLAEAQNGRSIFSFQLTLATMYGTEAGGKCEYGVLPVSISHIQMPKE